VSVSAGVVVTSVGDGEGVVSATVGTEVAKAVFRVKNAGEYRHAHRWCSGSPAGRFSAGAADTSPITPGS
jgi:hypothetical protein